MTAKRCLLWVSGLKARGLIIQRRVHGRVAAFFIFILLRLPNKKSPGPPADF